MGGLVIEGGFLGGEEETGDGGMGGLTSSLIRGRRMVVYRE